MSKPPANSTFTDANLAFDSKDLQRFNRALKYAAKNNPRGARQIVEISLLKAGHGTCDENSPESRMLLSSIEVLVTIAPSLSFNTLERALTLRALSVAEAVCFWSVESPALQRIQSIRQTIECTPQEKSVRIAVQAGTLGANIRRVEPGCVPALA